MSPPPRRSARLASAAKHKPLPDSSSAERDATPPHDGSRLPQQQQHDTGLSPARPALSTPKSAAPKPPREEMHPSLFRPTTGEPSSALRLGFSDIPAKQERPQGNGLTSTPSKIGGLLSSPFTFRFNRDVADDSLSGEAQRMLGEIRDQAAKIKADMVAQKEAQGEGTPRTGNRVIAKLKGRSGRFSAAHMAEFSKMDSIEGHASAWRAQNGRFTPLKSSLRASPSKPSLDTTPVAPTSAIRHSASKARFADTPDGRPRKNLKRTSSAANLDVLEVEEEPPKPTSVSKFGKRQQHVQSDQQSPAKRHKQRSGDDSSSSRPASRDGSSRPRPVTRADNPTSLKQSQSGISRLMSPTKASLAHSASTKSVAGTIPPSPSKASQLVLPKSGSTNAISLPSKATDLKRRIISPNRFNKVKSILRGHKIDMASPKSAIPLPALQGSQTPAPLRLDKSLPPVPLTTPRRKLSKRVDFTPQASKAPVAQDSPSPQKPQRAPLQAIEPPYPGVDDILSKPKTGSSLYPDLSPLKRLLDPRSRGDKARSPGMPGTFTFRSDHTIKFDDVSSKGFGASPGQSSIRQIRDSIVPVADMPGSFPAPPSPSCHSNKENSAPPSGRLLAATAHGMPNKKRHRASSDEEDAEKEAAARAMKKRKNEHVPEGQALLAPRLMGKTPSKTPSRLPGRAPGSVSPSKKGTMLSISRLNMLARPKNRT
ncbi:hypothetical protein HIM_07715 [Hirsutella minnesotensis 3608]|uniref:Erythromycin esterase n=1 Tax=Hirsutella minnesotensis 3608 TaxID=1043627 RepID=A0A0F7ZYR9_9HYPO|nr:hypothetical protein HIM_07715 [Hirsutella minnesotensis 3608]